MKNVTNWGNYPKIGADVIGIRSNADGVHIVKRTLPLIPRGLGRCYGDSSLAPTIVSTDGFNKILAFDPIAQLITCQAGVVFADLLEFLIPKGFFLPVTPGTKFITVGGAIASDVHGKNHHVDGSFTRHVTKLQIMLESGELVSCSRTEHSDLFWATCGGMGLTGLILAATFRLKKIDGSKIDQVSIKARNLEEVFELFERYKNTTYSVAWIDCLQKGPSVGRSILMVGEHDATPLNDSHFNNPIRVPFFFPSWILNKYSVRLFNFFYYHKQFSKLKKSKVSIDQFFYPLDFLNDWNKMYGHSGFVQYQFVLPPHRAKAGLTRILNKIADSGRASFLAVLKQFGGADHGMLSFPCTGYTLALDFPIKNGLFEFLDQLDDLVLEHEGRLYLTKDARMSASVFQRSYSNIRLFKQTILKYNPKGTFRSAQSDRLGITQL